MNGGNDPGTSGNLIHVRLRYFDPERRRAGVPDDVAALVDQIEDTSVSVTLVNMNQTQERTLIVQTGAYAEHTATGISIGDRRWTIDAPWFTVRLEPGAGARLRIAMQRYANQPTLDFPWDRERVPAATAAR
jgi:hypothetical protein